MPKLSISSFRSPNIFSSDQFHISGTCHDEAGSLFDPEDPSVSAFIYSLEQFNSVYTVFHRYACLIICFIGVVSNIIHILVLSRPRMRSSAVNCVLTAVAMCDVITMLSYATYLLRFRFYQDDEGYSYSWMVFLKFHVVSSMTLHAITLYMGAVLAFIRWQALGNIHSKWLQPLNAWRLFGVITCAITVICLPTLFLHEIFKLETTSVETTTILTDMLALGRQTIQVSADEYYSLNFSQYSCAFFKFNLWLVAIVLKAIPCVLLLWFTIALVLKLRQTDEKRNYLYSKSFRKHIKKTTVPDRTTYMLIIMLVVFLVTELPQGFLALLNGVYTTDMNTYIYRNVGELLDFLSLVNCSVDFLLYCVMSSRYRQTFGHMLIRVESWLRNHSERRRIAKEIKKKLPPPALV
ncbi:unnamed protein product [Caenorhabditis bovis]|uniref:G-protein coupled receptors family 1 profile domain-containing protein n=1 Tax=Caenorhabditis bovis TaxID=2654633 RepID=A0A8S1EX49_9PELO|nr:unnamed protein product [Caenorhabditis bovis]